MNIIVKTISGELLMLIVDCKATHNQIRARLYDAYPNLFTDPSKINIIRFTENESSEMTLNISNKEWIEDEIIMAFTDSHTIHMMDNGWSRQVYRVPDSLSTILFSERVPSCVKLIEDNISDKLTPSIFQHVEWTDKNGRNHGYINKSMPHAFVDANRNDRWE